MKLLNFLIWLLIYHLFVAFFMIVLEINEKIMTIITAVEIFEIIFLMIIKDAIELSK